MDFGFAIHHWFKNGNVLKKKKLQDLRFAITALLQSMVDGELKEVAEAKHTIYQEIPDCSCTSPMAGKYCSERKKARQLNMQWRK